MGNAKGCCIRREDESGRERVKWCRSESWHSIPDCEEQWALLDEGIPEDSQPSEEVAPPKVLPRGAFQRRSTMYRLRPDCRPLALVPEEALAGNVGDESMNLLSPMMALRPLTAEDIKFDPKVLPLQQGVRAAWKERIDRLSSGDEEDEELQQLLSEGFPELEEWTTIDTCRRFIRAVQGDEETAANMLIKAIECRVRGRTLFTTLQCEVTCDVRVIGRDNESRPAVYMCAGSQRTPIRDMMPQLILAFEAAVRLSRADGQLVLIADMHNFTPSMNMDPYALKELAGCFGTVFADRLNFVLIVDFSFLAQSVWGILKPMLSDRTRKKINFVGEAKAREIAKERLNASTYDRIVSAFDINRDKTSTPADRQAHAQRTAICDVPLGSVRLTDEAG